MVIQSGRGRGRTERSEVLNGPAGTTWRGRAQPAAPRERPFPLQTGLHSRGTVLRKALSLLYLNSTAMTVHFVRRLLHVVFLFLSKTLGDYTEALSCHTFTGHYTEARLNAPH